MFGRIGGHEPKNQYSLLTTHHLRAIQQTRHNLTFYDYSCADITIINKQNYFEILI